MAERHWVGPRWHMWRLVPGWLKRRYPAKWDSVNTKHWSTTSGGRGGASVPTTDDVVIFDQPGGVVRLDEPVTIGGVYMRSGHLDTNGMAVTCDGTPMINSDPQRRWRHWSTYIPFHFALGVFVAVSIVTRQWDWMVIAAISYFVGGMSMAVHLIFGDHDD